MWAKEVHEYTENDEVQVLSLKYKDPEYAFNVFLPKEKFGLEKFRAGLTGKKILTLLANLEKNLTIVRFRFFIYLIPISYSSRHFFPLAKSELSIIVRS